MPGKLGIGLYSPDAPIGDVINSRATACLVFDGALPLASEIKRRAPGMVIVGRRYIEPGYATDRLHLEPDALRAWWFSFGRSLALGYPDIDTWCCLNEVHVEIPGDYWDVLERQVAAELAFTDGVASAGRTSCVINQNPGGYPIPGEDKFPRYVSTVAPLLAHQGVGFLGVHLYSSGGPLQAIDAPYYATRYRALYHGLTDFGVRVPPIIVTEYGQANGWRGLFGEDACVQDFAWFAGQLDQDACVFGSTNFLDGTIDAVSWRKYDIAGTSIPGGIAMINGAPAPPVITGGSPPPVIVGSPIITAPSSDESGTNPIVLGLVFAIAGMLGVALSRMKG